MSSSGYKQLHRRKGNKSDPFIPVCESEKDVHLDSAKGLSSHLSLLGRHQVLVFTQLTDAEEAA